MKYISLFSGIGGFDYALEAEGFECVAVVEIDRDAQRVLRRHFPHAQLIDDVRKVGNKTHERGTIDLICGGSPCQDFSFAGKRAGIGGERSGLWYEFARIIDELEPKWVIFENVPGLYSSWSPVESPPFEMETRDFDTREEAKEWASRFQGDWRVEEESDFETILDFFQGRGYGVAWRVLDAQYTGVPQRRRRVFLVASFGDGRCAEVLFERECVSWDPAQSGEAREGASAVPGTSPTLRSEGHDASEDGNNRRAQ
jgi:DNA (cytosine-5)-methyltransferase 1